MAIVGAAGLISEQIIQAGKRDFAGSTVLPRIASAVGWSIPTWIPFLVNVTVTGTSVGVLGVGTVNGKMFFAGNPGLVVAALNAAGMTGPDAQKLGLAVGNGVWISLNQLAQYLGVSFNVGVGGDLSFVAYANEGTLLPILQSSLASVTIAGATSAQLALGLSRGITDLVRTGFGLGVVVGSPSPVPAVGTSLSTVV